MITIVTEETMIAAVVDGRNNEISNDECRMMNFEGSVVLYFSIHHSLFNIQHSNILLSISDLVPTFGL